MITPSLSRFREAVEWFKRRLAILKDEWNRLERRAQRRAFTVAGVAELDLVATVMDAIGRAVKTGETLETFKRRVGDQLALAWGHQNPWRLETIFRTNVQMAYQAGRWKQAQANKKARPFGRVSVVMDDRTTEICEALDSYTAPLDGAWFKEHWPPFHFNCRTTVITLTEAQAKASGLSLQEPKVEPAEGFGLPPTAAEWKPSLRGYPRDLVQAFRLKYRGGP